MLRLVLADIRPLSLDQRRTALSALSRDTLSALTTRASGDRWRDAADLVREPHGRPDSPLKEHTLLQAIARVNRTAEGKQWGLIVDSCGVSENVQEALSIFAPGDVVGALLPKHDELPRLQARHAAAMRCFARIPLRGRDEVEACVAALSADDVRAEFRTAFRRSDPNQAVGRKAGRDAVTDLDPRSQKPLGISRPRRQPALQLAHRAGPDGAFRLRHRA